MLQGDFHTGSLMVTQDTMYAIDAEFAFYGPMAFDIGKIIANLLLAYFASHGHEAATGRSRQKQRAWLLQVASLIAWDVAVFNAQTPCRLPDLMSIAGHAHLSEVPG